MRITILLATVLTLTTAHARIESCAPHFTRGLARALQHNAFKVDRTWSMYRDVLNDFGYGPSFAPAVHGLGPRGHWIDVGGGLAVPMLQLSRARFSDDNRSVELDPVHLFRLPRLSVVVLSDEFRDATADERVWLARLRTFRRAVDPRRFIYHAGTAIEAYADPAGTFGPADVLTDVVGAAAYTDDLTRVLTQYLAELKVGGVAFVNGVFERTKIRDCRGRDVSPEAFLAMIRGADVTPGDVRAIDNHPHSRGRLRTFRMIRNRAPAYVPPMKLIDVRGGLPPYRTFAFTKCD